MKKPKRKVKCAKNNHFLRILIYFADQLAFLSTFCLTRLRICGIIKSTNFGEKPCQKTIYKHQDKEYCDGYEVLLQPGTNVASQENWMLILPVEKDLSACGLNGGKDEACWNFLYRRKRVATSLLRKIESALAPENGTLAQVIENHPIGDVLYDNALSDSAAKLAALGYTDVECVFSSKIDVYAMRAMYRAFGNPMDPTVTPDPCYVVRYRLNAEDPPVAGNDGGWVTDTGMAMFIYDADGLQEAQITGMPCHETIRTEKIRYSPEEALRLISPTNFRAGTVLVDAYYELVQTDTKTNEYQGCWTFRFVAPSELNQVSDERFESTLELLGIAGRYMEMQCRVTVEDGTVLGGEWRFSQHLIHEYNSHYVKSP